jgi:N-acetyl-anhydromuramyl-L-alanine amidase AmpD
MWIKLFFQLLRLWLARVLTPKEETKSDLPVITNQDVYTEIKETPPVPEIKEEIKTIIEPVATKLNIIQKLLPPNQYVQDSKFKVQQCVIHHTAGGSAESTYNYWNSSKDRVATHFIIDRDGTIYQCMPMEKSWGYHLYIASPGNKIDRAYKKLSSKYDAQSVGVELANYGYVNFVNGKFVNYVGKLIHHDRVTKLDTPYKGYSYWEDYTKEQVDSLKLLLLHLIEEYPILSQGLIDDYSNIGEISKDALDMKPGIYGHAQYRTDKYDIFPSKRIIEMLNSLKPTLNVVV